jgi:hypothetical protein
LNFVFGTKILGQYPALLYECAVCGFQFFHDARIWLEQAYTTPIAHTDTGIVRRSLNIHRVVSSFLGISNITGKVLDWGSGSGLLVRLLRDDGHDCYGYEPYTEPVLASGHTYKEENAVFAVNWYRAIIAIEVVEHLVNPIVFFQKTLTHTDTLIFSTELVDRAKNGNNWWYYSRETGQHISFFTEKSLIQLAKLNGCVYGLAESKGLHIFTRRPSDLMIFKWIAGCRRSWLVYLVTNILSKLTGRCSLMMSDHVAAKKALADSQF